ncbi:hypothetical protein EPI10_028197 [Gossypium australe]|uniref:Uncharacterized protein n=1 Tax=Gossypium australe TaxID=47621 RepID=A0A5B6UYR2_9ROSI|nr:hypothetical protein EPI10_028197 [Gossypium australe]
MNNEISEFVMKCLTYRTVKKNYQACWKSKNGSGIGSQWILSRGFLLVHPRRIFLGNCGSIDKVNQFHGGVNELLIGEVSRAIHFGNSSPAPHTFFNCA